MCPMTAPASQAQWTRRDFFLIRARPALTRPFRNGIYALSAVDIEIGGKCPLSFVLKNRKGENLVRFCARFMGTAENAARCLVCYLVQVARGEPTTTSPKEDGLEVFFEGDKITLLGDSTAIEAAIRSCLAPSRETHETKEA